MDQLLADLVPSGHVYALTGVALAAIGLLAFIVQSHALRKLIALNVVGSGIFLILGGLGRGGDVTDPMPQALVITGIVVAVALSGVGAAMIVRVVEEAATPQSATPAESKSEQ